MGKEFKAGNFDITPIVPIMEAAADFIIRISKDDEEALQVIDALTAIAVAHIAQVNGISREQALELVCINVRVWLTTISEKPVSQVNENRKTE